MRPIALAASTLLALPSTAFACPACASHPVDTHAVLIALGAFLLVPFGVAAAVIAVILHVARTEST